LGRPRERRVGGEEEGIDVEELLVARERLRLARDVRYGGRGVERAPELDEPEEIGLPAEEAVYVVLGRGDHALGWLHVHEGDLVGVEAVLLGELGEDEDLRVALRVRELLALEVLGAG